MTNNISKALSISGDSLAHAMSDNHIRIAVIGNVDAGKSTLIGSLTTGLLDDGKGTTRSLITKYKHEAETGRTSTITSHLLGFDESGSIVPLHNKSDTSSSHQKLKCEDEIAKQASRFISLVDLAGHERYLKSTIHGISSSFVDYALVLVNSRHPPTHMTMQHFNLINGYGVPAVVLLTKIDGCPEHVFKNTKNEVFKVVQSQLRKKPFMIKKASDIPFVKQNMHALSPVISLSAVSGENIGLLSNLLHEMPKRREHKKKMSRKFEFLVDDVFNITGVGPVVSGFVNAGKLQIGQNVHVGPLADGDYIKTTAKSFHVARTHVPTILAGNTACIALSLNKSQRKLLRKGIYCLEEPVTPSITFEAEMTIMKGSGVDGTTIKKGYETMVHILHVKQPARVENIELLENVNDAGGFVMTYHSINDDGGVVIRPGCRARIRFRFMKRNGEFIRKGMKILFRDGHARGCGVVTSTSANNNNSTS